jgi:ABC-type Fe3+ transport system permease subunit
MRIVTRLLGLFSLLVALLVLAADLAAAGQGGDTEIMPLGALWFSLDSDSLNLVQVVIERYIWGPLWDPVLLAVLQWPAAPAFGILGALLMVLSFLRLPAAKDKAGDETPAKRAAAIAKSTTRPPS